MTDWLGMFAKQPLPGRVKTRLAAGFGADHAAMIYRAFQIDLTVRFANAGDRRFLCTTPDDKSATDFFLGLAGNFPIGPAWELWPQPGGSLGDRLRAWFRFAFESGAERVLVIGSDSPTLPRRIIDDAFAALDRSRVVIGPATDGGYYLLGQRGPFTECFESIDWSTADVLGQTVTALAGPSDPFTLLPPWPDVDTPEDLTALSGYLSALKLAIRHESDDVKDFPAATARCVHRVLNENRAND